MILIIGSAILDIGFRIQRHPTFHLYYSLYKRLGEILNIKLKILKVYVVLIILRKLPRFRAE